MDFPCSRPLAAVALGLLLAGCAGVPAPAPAPATVAPGLSADVVQQRRDVESGALQVELSLAAGSPALDVSAVHLRSGAFPAAGEGRAVVVGPGVVVDVPVDPGQPACDGTAPGRMPATAVLDLRGGGAVEVALPDADGYLARVHAQACDTAAVAAVLPVRWDPAWTARGAGADLRATGVLHLGPVAAGHRAVLEEVGATPLFQYRLRDAALPLVLEAGQSADVAVVLDPARCDAHAVADDKRGFGPELSWALDGAAAVRVRAWVPRADRSVPTEALLAACSGGP